MRFAEKKSRGPRKQVHEPPLSDNNNAYFVKASLRLPSAVA